MEIKVLRDKFTLESTTSIVEIDGTFECFFLEDMDRGLTSDMSEAEITAIKIAGSTAIPTGRYEIVVNHSMRFKRLMPLIVGVKGFTAIRIHAGNNSADTDGCPLTGKTRITDNVGLSQKAFNELYPKIKSALDHEKVFIEIARKPQEKEDIPAA